MSRLDPYKLLQVHVEPNLIERINTITRSFPEYEDNRSLLLRRAIREFIDRKERELADREAQPQLAEAA